MARVSVVMPAYNSAPTIAVALESIFVQSYKNLEIIVVYDDSTDATLEILNSLKAKDSRLRIFRNPDAQNNLRRMPAALNFGLGVSSGEFIARMDSDDISLPNRLDTQVSFLDSHPEIDLCGMGMALIGQQGDLIRELPAVCGVARTRILARYAPPLYHPTWMFRRDILAKLRGYRDMYSEDYDFLLRALDAGFNLDNCSEIGLRYRIHPAHRGSLQAHKSNEFAYRMHRRRLRGLPDGYSVNAARHAAAVGRWQKLERLGQAIMHRGFALEERHRLLGTTMIALSLLFLPASARAALRKLKAAFRLSRLR